MRLRQENGGGVLAPGTRRVVAWALILAAVLFFLPALLLLGREEGGEEESLPQATLPADPSAAAASGRDRGRVVRLLQEDGQVTEMTMADYLWGVVAAEMPAAFELEALKAQACAARTYTLRAQNSAGSKHPGADICTQSTCCQAYVERGAAEARWGLNAGEYGDKIDQAVAQTDGLGILYQGEPIQALFFSSAPGKTVDAVEVWGNSVDYLKSVDSPEGEEVPNYHSQVVLSQQQVQQAVLAAYPGADLSGEPETWFSQISREGDGAVTSLVLGGITLTGSQVRTLFSLRSAAFSLTWDGSSFTFDVTGYGHGVGMSQYGANALAKEGKTFEEILTWYYTDTQVAALWD